MSPVAAPPVASPPSEPLTTPSPTISVDVTEAHARLLRDQSLQFDRVGFTPPEIPGWLRWIGHALEFIQPALKYVFWGGLILLVGLIVFAIGQELLKLRAPKARVATPPTVPPTEWRPEPAHARDLLKQADALAADGLYAEAAHLLLLRSVEDIQKRSPKALRASLTTREITALTAIPEGARPAFAKIGRVVEASLFGSATVSPDQFADCRQAYEAFALPDGWRA